MVGMKRWAWVLVVAGVVVIAVGGYVAKLMFAYPKAEVAVAHGSRAPDFTLMDAQGKPFTLSAQRGRRVVINFYRGYW